MGIRGGIGDEHGDTGQMDSKDVHLNFVSHSVQAGGDVVEEMIQPSADVARLVRS
jgi:hypothetical protein